MVTNAGGGGTRWKDLAVTRWREDSTCDNWGSFCYIRDTASGDFWSTAHQPTRARPARYEAIFTEARAEFRRRDKDFESHVEIVVSPEDDIELRRLRITNRSRMRRTIDVTSYAEVALATPRLGRAASGVFQSLRADRDRPRAAGHPVHATAPLAGRAGALDVPPHGRPRTAVIRRFLRDGPDGVHRPRPHRRGAAGDARAGTARRRPGIGAGPDRRDPAPDHARPAADGDGRHDLRHGRHARLRVEPRRQIPGSASGGPRLRSRVDPQRSHAAADQCLRVGCAALRASCGLRDLRQCVVARGGRHSPAQPARAVGTVELRHLRRLADRAAADRRLRQHRPRAPARAGARVLAPEGIGGGPRDLERGPRRISASAAGSDHGTDRRRHRGARDGSAGRDLRAPGGADRGRGPHPDPVRGARHHLRPPGKPLGTGHPPRPRGSSRSAPRAEPHPSQRSSLRRTASARVDPGQRRGRLHSRRHRIRHHAASGRGYARAMVQRVGESEFRNGHLRKRTRLHLERERP